MVDAIELHHKKEHFKQSTPLDIIEAEDYTTTTNDDHDNGSSQQKQHESSVFHNIESLVRNIDDNSDSDGNGGMSVHDKHSNEKNYSPPTPPPTPSPVALSSSTEEDTIYYSLPDYHSSNGNGDASSSSISHAKYSQEKNALNPNELPEEWIIAKTPSASPIIMNSSPAPTEDIRRVNPYITNNNNGEGDSGEGEEYEHCRASKSTGVYFDSGSDDNNNAIAVASRSCVYGIVLR